MTDLDTAVAIAHLRPVYGERWKIILLNPTWNTALVRRRLTLPPCLRDKTAALDIAEPGKNILGLGRRSVTPSRRGAHVYAIHLTRAEYDQLVAALNGEDRA